MTRKLASILAAAGVTLSTHVASADFHISDLAGEALIACPSNHYNCKCFVEGDRRKTVFNEQQDFFQLEAGMCGVSRVLDFYRRPEGHYDFYIDNGDGQLQGQCFRNDDTQTCGVPPGGIAFVNDWLVCYSYICK